MFFYSWNENSPPQLKMALPRLKKPMVILVILIILIILRHDSGYLNKLLKENLKKWSPSLHKQKFSQFRTISSSDIQTMFGDGELPPCKEHRKKLSEVKVNNQYWQEIRLRDVYLYSAYYDVRYRFQNESYHFIRILASSKGFLREPMTGLRRNKLYCHLWFSDREEPEIVESKIQEIWLQEFDPRPPFKTYHSYLISCPVTHKSKTINSPEHVSVSADYCEPLSNYLPVYKDGLKEIRSGQAKDQYIICVKGLNFEKDISERLVEWVELNLLLGASGVDFYVYSLHPRVRKVIEFYEREGVANVIDITLPGDQPNDERRDQYLKYNLWQKRRNELIPYNDCLYRNMYSYKFIIPLDIDEILMPVEDDDWRTVFRKLFKKDRLLMKKYASISVSNVYFFDKWNTTVANKNKSKLYTNPDNIDTKNPADKFYMLHHLRRTSNFSQPGHHVKSFISTKNTLLTFNHYTMQPLYKNISKNVIIDRSLIQLNHYQEKCSRYILSQCKSHLDIYATGDDIISKYEEDLKRNVNNIWQEIENEEYVVDEHTDFMNTLV